MKFLIFYVAAITTLYGNFPTVTKTEIKTKYQDLGHNCSDYILALKGDYRLSYCGQRELFLGLNIPYIWLDCTDKIEIEVDEEGIVSDRPSRKIQVKRRRKENGLSDLSTTAFFTIPVEKEITLGFGLDLLFPTATCKELGTGKYRAKPEIGILYKQKDVRTALLAKYEFSYAGLSHRPNIQIFYLELDLALRLPRAWAFSLNSETQYNCKQKKWFVPLGTTLSKKFGNYFATSLGYQMGLIRDFPVFKQEVSLSLLYLF